MNKTVKEAYRDLLEKQGKKRRQPSWNGTWTEPFDFGSKGWAEIGKRILRAMDNLADRGIGSPLAKLQAVALAGSLKDGADPAAHTIALWLTDTRLRIEALKSPGHKMERGALKDVLRSRGVMKKKRR